MIVSKRQRNLFAHTDKMLKIMVLSFNVIGMYYTFSFCPNKIFALIKEKIVVALDTYISFNNKYFLLEAVKLKR